MNFRVQVDVYIYEDELLLPTTVNFDNGFFVMQEPVATISLSDRPSIIASIASTLAVGNPRMPMRSPKELFKNFVYKYAGVRSQSKFMEKARHWAIDRTQEGYKITTCRAARGGHWAKAGVITFADDGSVIEAATRIVDFILESNRSPQDDYERAT
jgi:hypothetical protein